MADQTTPRFLTIDEAAEQLGLSRNQVRVMVQRRHLTGVRTADPDRWRIEADSKLESYLARKQA